jgi:hypothetical protein
MAWSIIGTRSYLGSAPITQFVAAFQDVWNRIGSNNVFLLAEYKTASTTDIAIITPKLMRYELTDTLSTEW